MQRLDAHSSAKRLLVLSRNVERNCLIAAITAMNSFNCANARCRIRTTLAEAEADVESYCYAESAFACETFDTSAIETPLLVSFL